MRFTLRQIADLVNGELTGSPDLVITGISGIKEAKEGDITFLANSKYVSLIQDTEASAVITSREPLSTKKPLIKTDNPSMAFTAVVELLLPGSLTHPEGIHPTAVISKDAVLAEGVSVGAYAVIEKGVTIGKGTTIYSGCYIGQEAKIGKSCLIYPQVSLMNRVVVNDRVIIHPGAVIGSDGFGFVQVCGSQRKIPQIGTVLIEDDVEIGANVTIDRARFDKTIIGRGTKIDNLVQIAHNVVTGENCIIVAQAGISGSTIIGKDVILAGQAGLVGHIRIGDKAIVAAQAGVTKSVPAGVKVSGYPAKPHNEAKRVNAC
ncbi:MAG: UDP-3-O-(3-hydroxymyristoyl)glucosamine N-acyltransferase, partial [Candidatus Omnitrophica bacterium]|nr:UDP-3-O-(3-hydroxymyristoyl)glucosamine N-acyltransferase [Candidatus Omnitrophota bacterium]